MSDVVVEKDMSASAAEIRRGLVRLFGAEGEGFDGRRLSVARGRGRIEITLLAVGERKIANLILPTAQVRIALAGFDGDAAEAFLAEFERTFQRGGG